MTARKRTDSFAHGAGLWVARRIARWLFRFPGTGLPRIAERLRRRTARWAAMHPEPADVWIDDFQGGSHFCCDLFEHMGSQIFFRGSYSGGQLVVLQRLLSPEAVFVDAGANQGEFTVCAAAQVHDGHVFSFEPVPEVRHRLERNVVANAFDNVTIYPVGLSDNHRDDVPIYGADCEFLDGTQNLGLSTLFGVSGRSNILATISLRQLDDVLSQDQRVDVMKIDVEGAEWAVLKGAEGTIARERPAIIFEANEKTCRAAGYSVSGLLGWLETRGYDLWRIGGHGELSRTDNAVAFSNVLAVPRERRELASLAGAP